MRSLAADDSQAGHGGEGERQGARNEQTRVEDFLTRWFVSRGKETARLTGQGRGRAYNKGGRGKGAEEKEGEGQQGNEGQGAEGRREGQQGGKRGC